MSFSWFELLLLIGVTQGLITSVLLFYSNNNKISNRYLALSLIAFCLISIKMIINTLGLSNYNHIYHFMPLATELAIAPLIYLYSVSLINPKAKFSQITLVHFIPFVLFQLYAFLIYANVFNIEAFNEKILVTQNYHYSILKGIEDYLTVASIFAYLTLGFLKLKEYRQHVKDNISASNQPTFTWLINIILLSSLLLIFLVANMLISRLTNFQVNSILHWKIYFIYIACIIYYLGLRGYKLAELNIKPIEKELPLKAAQKLTAEKIEHVSTIFKNTLLDNKLYLEPTISAIALSKTMGVSQSNLSYAINQYFGKSFRDFVNELRIEEVKSRLRDVKYNKVSVLAIALECGFNSEASFYRIFKNSTGMSPKAFSAQHGT